MKDTHIAFEVSINGLCDKDGYVIETIAELIPCNMIYEEESDNYIFCCQKQRDFLECVRILTSALYDFSVNTIILEGKVADNLECGY